MSPDRFARIVDAYGSEPRRWPADERAAAEAFARDHVGAATILAEAGTIDDLLFAHRDPVATPALRRAIVAAAPQPLWRRFRLWWSGLMLAAGAAGVLAGSAAAAYVPGNLPVPGFFHGDATVAELGAWDGD